MDESTCSIDGCEKPSRTRGWCDMHYRRWQRYGDPAQAHGPRPCRVCGREDLPKSRTTRYCVECFNARERAQRAATRVDPTCLGCGITFTRTHSRQKFCPECREARAKRVDPICAECGATFRRTHPRRKFCTDECYQIKELRESRIRAPIWAAANRDRRLEYGHRRRAMTRGTQVIPITMDMLAARAAVFGNKCWMCSGPFEQWDHVKPLAKGGPHMLSNLRPACGQCNRAKHAKWDGPRAA